MVRARSKGSPLAGNMLSQMRCCQGIFVDSSTTVVKDVAAASSTDTNSIILGSTSRIDVRGFVAGMRRAIKDEQQDDVMVWLFSEVGRARLPLELSAPEVTTAVSAPAPVPLAGAVYGGESSGDEVVEEESSDVDVVEECCDSDTVREREERSESFVAQQINLAVANGKENHFNSLVARFDRMMEASQE